MFIIEPQSVVDYFDLWATPAMLSSASKPCLDAFPIFIAGVFAYIPALCRIFWTAIVSANTDYVACNKNSTIRIL